MPTTDGKLSHQTTPSRPLIESQRLPSSHAQEELGDKSILLRNAWRGTQLTLYLKQRDFMAHGTLDNCPGCRALVSGGRAQGHTEESRIRVENELRKTEEGKARLHAPSIRVGDAPTGRALKRVRFDAGGHVSVGTIKSPCRSCDVQFFASTFIRASVSVCR